MTQVRACQRLGVTMIMTAGLTFMLSTIWGPGGSADRLYHNLGNGRFEDVSHFMYERKRSGAGFVASWLDYDNDGDQDLYVVNDDFFGDHKGNVLWMNDGPGKNGWAFYDASTRLRTNTVLNGMGLSLVTMTMI